VKLGYYAKAKKRLTGFVCNFHPPLRTIFYWIITITEYFASGSLLAEPRQCRGIRVRRCGQMSCHRDEPQKSISACFPQPLKSIATTFGYASYSA
jgi:hypothetical protein